MLLNHIIYIIPIILPHISRIVYGNRNSSHVFRQINSLRFFRLLFCAELFPCIFSNFRIYSECISNIQILDFFYSTYSWYYWSREKWLTRKLGNSKKRKPKKWIDNSKSTAGLSYRPKSSMCYWNSFEFPDGNKLNMQIFWQIQWNGKSINARRSQFWVFSSCILELQAKKIDFWNLSTKKPFIIWLAKKEKLYKHKILPATTIRMKNRFSAQSYPNHLTWIKFHVTRIFVLPSADNFIAPAIL